MNYRAISVSLALLALLAVAMPDGRGPFAPVHARPDHAEKGGGKAGKGHGNKGPARHGQGKQGNDGQGGAGGHWHGTAGDAFSRWQRDWGIEDFVGAGLTAAIVRELLGDNGNALNTGASGLPPGIAKNLARGKPLPPGIAKKQPGAAVLGALPRIDGHNWLEIGASLVLIEAGTQIVREIVHGVFY